VLQRVGRLVREVVVLAHQQPDGALAGRGREYRLVDQRVDRASQAQGDERGGGQDDRVRTHSKASQKGFGGRPIDLDLHGRLRRGQEGGVTLGGNQQPRALGQGVQLRPALRRERGTRLAPFEDGGQPDSLGQRGREGV
jgi:hypothetical protein